jgi:hypothetical protein
MKDMRMGEEPTAHRASTPLKVVILAMKFSAMKFSEMNRA